MFPDPTLRVCTRTRIRTRSLSVRRPVPLSPHLLDVVMTTMHAPPRSFVQRRRQLRLRAPPLLLRAASATAAQAAHPATFVWRRRRRLRPCAPPRSCGDNDDGTGHAPRYVRVAMTTMAQAMRPISFVQHRQWQLRPRTLPRLCGDDDGSDRAPCRVHVATTMLAQAACGDNNDGTGRAPRLLRAASATAAQAACPATFVRRRRRRLRLRDPPHLLHAAASTTATTMTRPFGWVLTTPTHVVGMGPYH